MRSVGIFDSGVGGLSVLAEFRKLAPQHPVVYLADQAWAPYGERSLAQVRDRSVAITRYLIDRGCDLIVVACNSASAAALHHLRQIFPGTLFVGMEPAVKPAASQSSRGIIGVMATEATFQGELYASVLDRHADGAEVVEQSCAGLADAIERNGVEHPETKRLVVEYVAPLGEAGVDTIVLGCTHYPFVLGAIEAAAGPGVTVIDPAPAVARQTVRLLGDQASDASTEFITTGASSTFAAQIGSLLGVSAEVGEVDIGAAARVSVVVGDLTKQDVAAIVNAANQHLQHGGGVAAAIARAGGSIVQEESDRWVRENGPLSVGRAAITSAGAMAARHVVHVAGPIYRDGQDNAALLEAAVVAALDAAREAGADSVALPAISAGIYGYPIAEATAVLAATVVGWLDRNPDAVDEVRFVALDQQVAAHFQTGLAQA